MINKTPIPPHIFLCNSTMCTNNFVGPTLKFLMINLRCPLILKYFFVWSRKNQLYRTDTVIVNDGSNLPIFHSLFDTSIRIGCDRNLPTCYIWIDSVVYWFSLSLSLNSCLLARAGHTTDQKIIGFPSRIVRLGFWYCCFCLTPYWWNSTVDWDKHLLEFGLIYDVFFLFKFWD